MDDLHLLLPFLQMVLAFIAPHMPCLALLVAGGLCLIFVGYFGNYRCSFFVNGFWMRCWFIHARCAISCFACTILPFLTPSITFLALSAQLLLFCCWLLCRVCYWVLFSDDLWVRCLDFLNNLMTSSDVMWVCSHVVSHRLFAES